MRRLSYLAAMLFSLVSLGAYAQQRTCASHDVFVQQLSNNPLFVKNQQAIEAFTQRFIKEGGTRRMTTTARGTATYTIPVVVHVVYHTAAQNVSDAQVQSQIDIMNEDFQKLNQDTAMVPAAFKELIADCKIQFCLARQDPDGNPTTGIIRKYTDKTGFSSNDGVKKNSSGGDNAWDATRYLNLWVCNLNGGLLGYAQFPGGAAATDGVVVLYSAFGNMGAAKAPFNKGRTATHEVGHWLNLRHIWGDDSGLCTGSDQVDDTPNAGGPNYGCPSFPRTSCLNGPDGDMFMNYMDYSDDACMQMFTPGQRDRMYAVLQSGGARASLASSPACSQPAGGCGKPTNLVSSNITQSTATVSWEAIPGAATYTLQYKVTGTSPYTTISGVTAASYELTGLTGATAYTYKVKAICSGATGKYSSTASFTTLDASCTDTYESNDSKSKAKAIPLDKAIKATIGSSGDVDFFKFTTNSIAPDFKVTLSNLPKDYDLKLYDPSGKQIAVSQNGGTNTESVSYNGGVAGTYKVQVYGYNGAFSTNCYTLKVATSTGIIDDDDVTSRKVTATSGVTVYPQPASSYTIIQFGGSAWKGTASLSVISQLGQLVLVKQINMEGRQYRLDVSNLANGVYYLKISNDATTATQKIVVQH